MFGGQGGRYCSDNFFDGSKGTNKFSFFGNNWFDVNRNGGLSVFANDANDGCNYPA